MGAKPAWRCSSAWQSKRLIIAVSPVQIRPPLPAGSLAGSRRAGCPSWYDRGSWYDRAPGKTEARERECSGRHGCAPEDHTGVPAVQAPQLHHAQEPAQRPRPDGAEEVLSQLRPAHGASRDALTPTGSEITYEGAGRGPGRQSEPDSESGRSVLPGLLPSRRVCPPGNAADPRTDSERGNAATAVPAAAAHSGGTGPADWWERNRREQQWGVLRTG